MTASSRLERRDGSALNCVLRQASIQGAVLLMVMGLALSSLGPVIDHHFAERHPGHQHLYLGTALPDHSHSYERSHAHYGSWMYSPAAAGSPSDGIVFFMPNDGSGHGAVDIAMPLIVQPLRLDGGGDGQILQPFSADGVLTGAVIAPSKRPPRA